MFLKVFTCRAYIFSRRSTLLNYSTSNPTIDYLWSGGAPSFFGYFFFFIFSLCYSQFMPHHTLVVFMQSGNTCGLCSSEVCLPRGNCYFTPHIVAPARGLVSIVKSFYNTVWYVQLGVLLALCHVWCFFFYFFIFSFFVPFYCLLLGSTMVPGTQRIRSQHGLWAHPMELPLTTDSFSRQYIIVLIPKQYVDIFVESFLFFPFFDIFFLFNATGYALHYGTLCGFRYSVLCILAYVVYNPWLM